VNWSRVGLVFHRELRDQLRDRRTLLLQFVLPVLLYPAIGIGMLQMTLLFAEQPRTVVILEANSLPDLPGQPLLDGNLFAERWFDKPEDSATLAVINDATPPPSEEAAKQLKTARRVRQRFDATSGRDTRIATMLDDAGIDVLVLVPENLAANVRRIDEAIRNRSPVNGDHAGPKILVGGTEKSMIASRRVRRVFERWEKALLLRRLNAAGLPASLTAPVNPQVVEVAAEKGEAALVWSKLYPVILVLMTVTGAFYPAVDLAAGEKERGTMETLLITPARRLELVAAKFGCIMVFSLVTALLNLVSLGVTAGYMMSALEQRVPAGQLKLTPPSLAGVAWVLVMLIPLAALFSALCLALATFAKSTREGQYYLMPLMIGVIMLVVFAASPGAELKPFHAMIPVLGPTMLLKELLLDPGGRGPLLYVLPVLASSFAWAGLALWWAVDQFHREDVLFREAERIDLWLWAKRLWTDKPAVPGPGGAAALLALMMAGGLVFLTVATARVSGHFELNQLIRLHIIQQVLLFVLPAALLGLLLVRDRRATFRWRWPSWPSLGAALVLPVLLHPLVIEMAHGLQDFFPSPGDNSPFAVLEKMIISEPRLWLVLLAFAAVPAICEEFTFRGYLLSALGRNSRTRRAIILSSLAFGFAHLVPQQVFMTGLLGLVLGLLAVNSRSLLPGIVFHAVFNVMSVLYARHDPEAIEGGPLALFLGTETIGDRNVLRYEWPLLGLCGVAAAWLLWRQVRSLDTAR